MKIKRTLAILTLGLGIALVTGLFAFISLATIEIPTFDPPRHSHTAPLTTTISISYAEPISAATVTSRTFAVFASQTGMLTDTRGVSGGRIVVTPSHPLHQGELVYAIATSGTLNLSGSQAFSPTQWQFRAGWVAPRCVAGFSPVDAGLTGAHHSEAVWGDYDNDGDLDVLLAGYSDEGAISRIYRNDGPSPEGWTFSDVDAGLQGVQDGGAAWGDYDNDGDLDVLLTGQSSSGRVARLYRNDGSDSFGPVEIGLPGFYWGSAAWGDYDNDGDLDVILTGYSDLSRRTAKLYRNDGPSPAPELDWTFTDVNADLKGTRWGMAAWGDYDNDGNLDILISGYGGGGKDVTRVYRNQGAAAGWTFSDSGANLVQVEASSTAWGDYDNDGDLDVLLTGFVVTESVRLTRLYQNQGPAEGWSYSDVGADLEDVAYGAVAWGDYDNDGDLDILLTGEKTDETILSHVYRNDGSAAGWTFSRVDVDLAPVAYGSVDWGDYDDDGDLDILLSGYNLTSQIYRNDDCSPDPTLVKTITTPSSAGTLIVGQPPTAAPGETVTYTLAFSNAGVLTATQVLITDLMPLEPFAALTYTASNGDISGTASPPYAWHLAQLPPGAGGIITLSGVLSPDLPAGLVIHNQARITAASDGDPTNNTSVVSFTVSPPAASLVYLPVVIRGAGSSGANATRRPVERESYRPKASPPLIDAAIQAGAAWLAGDQQSNGSWSDHTAVTCFALSVLQQHAYELGFDTWDVPGYPYRDHIIQGWQYVLTPTRTVKVTPLSVQPAGDPDTNGNGYGVSFQYDSRHHVYAEGVCVMALQASGTPDRQNDGGLDYDDDGNPDTFLELAQEAVDWTAFAQLDGGNGRGNWFYTAEDNGSGNPDQSNGGFATLGLIAAESMGATVPDFVRAELDYAIDYIQCSNPGADYGGAGYSSPCSYVNEYKAGFLIAQMGFYGDSPAVQRFQDALDYMDRHWQDENNSPGWGYNSSPSSYLAMFALTKGLRYNGIQLLDTDGDGARDDEWYNQELPASPAQDFATVLLSQQEGDGSWPTCDWGNQTSCTTWALLTLQKAAPTRPNQPDALIRVGSAGDLVGDDVYNTDGAAQTVNATAAVSATATYQVRIENDGNLSHTYTVTGTDNSGVWHLTYRDSDGLDVTEQITGAGWSTNDLAPGQAVTLTVEVMPDSMPDNDPTHSLLLVATSTGEPARRDVVRADTTVAGYYYLDLGLQLESDRPLVASGESITYTLAFSNAGTLTATQIIITSALPPEPFQTLTYTLGGAGLVTGTATALPYAWQVDELAPGAGGAITISGVLSPSLPDGLVIHHTAGITTTTTPDADPSNNAASVAITVSVPSAYRIYLPVVMRCCP